MACEQGILAIQSDWANGSLDRVAIDFDGAVIDEPRQPVTTLETVADDFGHFATPGQERQLLLQPTEQIVDEWRGVDLTHGTAFLGTAASDLGLDLVKRGDAIQNFCSDRRRPTLVDVKEVSSPMRPAKRQVQGIFLPASIGQRVIAGVSVNLENALEATECLTCIFASTAWRINVDDARRIRAVPWPIVASDCPQIAGLCFATSRIEHGHCRFIAEQFGRSFQQLQHPRDDRLQRKGAAPHPIGQTGAIDLDALALQDLVLAIQRQMISIFADQDMGQHRLGG